MNAALQQSSDQSTPASASTFAGTLNSPTGASADGGLGALSNPTPSLAANITSDPIVQWATSDHGSFTSVPLPASGDDPDTAANKVFGQSIAGFGDLMKGLAQGPVGFAKSLYGYGTKMVDQISADLGLATTSIFSDTGGDSP